MRYRIIENKNAFITGASGGLGKEIAVEFARRGCNLYLTGRNSTKLKRLKSKLSEFKTKVEYGMGDLYVIEDINTVIADAREKMGFIDILINCAAHVIEANRDCSFIKTKLHIPFIQDYYRPNSFNYRFNLISLIYLLEHLSHPVSLLKSLHSDMTRNSLLFIEVPDAICFQHKPAEDDIFKSCHLWMFSPNTLTLLLDYNGFEVFNLYQMKTIRGYYALMVLAGQKHAQ